MDNQQLLNLLNLLNNFMGSNSGDKNNNPLDFDIDKLFSIFKQYTQGYPEKHREDHEDYHDDYHDDYPNDADTDDEVRTPTVNNNFNFPQKDTTKEPCPICETKELVKNGGFEITTPTNQQVFMNWLQADNRASINATQISYEGKNAASFVSESTAEPKFKMAILSQNITVTPGCRYELSFAENFFKNSSEVSSKARLTARIFYGDPSNPAKQVDLVNIDIFKPDLYAVENRGYSFHQKAAESPVPKSVSTITVEYKFEVTDVGGTEWKIDGVSVRGVPIA